MRAPRMRPNQLDAAVVNHHQHNVRSAAFIMSAACIQLGLPAASAFHFDSRHGHGCERAASLGEPLVSLTENRDGVERMESFPHYAGRGGDPILVRFCVCYLLR